MIVVLSIVTIGLVMVYSASNIWAEYKFDDALFYAKRQALFVVLGIIGMIVFSKIDYHVYQRNYQKILLGGFLLLILVLIPGIGSVRGGSRSWFSFGAFSLQPSELFKIALIIYAANFMSEHYHEVKRLKRCWKLFLVVGLGFALIMGQPDFGSGVVMVCSIVVMLIVSPFPFKYFVMLGMLGVVGIVLMILAAPYRMERITAFLDPFADPLGSGFQMIQSLFAIGPGGILGAGFNQSIQKHFYLPEPQTDFIFAIYLEEFGMIGGMVLVGLYGYFISLGLKLAKECKDIFGCFLMIGIVSLIGIQTLINLGVVVGLLPVTGVTLPLMSYGGSSLTITLIAVGILLNISKSS